MNETKIISVPVIGKWVKIGEVIKTGGYWSSLYKRYAVMEMINEDGMRKYREVFMASDNYHAPDLRSQKFEINELNP